MDASLRDLAQQTLANYHRHAANGAKYFIGLAAPPGAGKTAVAGRVCAIINELEPGICAVLPMDGFHLTKAELNAMPDPAEAFRRRGAAWTFAPDKLYSLLLSVKQNNEGRAPSFDHKVGDPIENDIEIQKQHRIVIVEGNYILMDEGRWGDIAKLCDERWFIDIQIDRAMARVVRRHIGTGLSHDKAVERVETNDRLNGVEIIAKSKANATTVLQSIDDETMQRD